MTRSTPNTSRSGTAMWWARTQSGRSPMTLRPLGPTIKAVTHATVASAALIVDGGTSGDAIAADQRLVENEPETGAGRDVHHPVLERGTGRPHRLAHPIA